MPNISKGPTRDGVYLHQAHVSSRVPGLDAARPILDVLAQPVVVTDLKATILYWNQSATDLYGFRADEALGQCLHSLLQCPPFEVGRESVDTLTGKRYSKTRQLEGRSRSGRALTVLMTMTPLGRENGDPIALIGIAVDITTAANDHRGLKVDDQTHLAVGHSARHRNDSAPQTLRAIVGAETAAITARVVTIDTATSASSTNLFTITFGFRITPESSSMFFDHGRR